MNNRTAVVMLTWNRLNTLKNTIDTFRKYNPQFKDEDFIIVDNGSNDGTQKFLKHTKFDTILNSQNTGAQWGKFIGWKKAKDRKYDFILFIEDDHPCYRTIPIKDLENYLDINNDIGIIRLNDKPYLKRHQITKLPTERISREKLNDEFMIDKWYYHFTSHSSIFRTSLVKYLKNNIIRSYQTENINFDMINVILNKYKGTPKHKLAMDRITKEFGVCEKEYMRLYLLQYNYTGQLNPPCFKWVNIKRMNGWKN